MDHVSITIPAALYAAIYAAYGEGSGDAITQHLSQLVDIYPRAQTLEQSNPPRQAARPKPGTITGRVWSIADQIERETGTITRDDVVAAALEQGINVNTASTQFTRWKKARDTREFNPRPLAGARIGAANYGALEKYLKRIPSTVTEQTMSFTDLESVLGGELPESAYSFRQWWANQAHRPQANAWLSAGFEISEVRLDRAAGWIRFRRVG